MEQTKPYCVIHPLLHSSQVSSLVEKPRPITTPNFYSSQLQLNLARLFLIVDDDGAVDHSPFRLTEMIDRAIADAQKLAVATIRLHTLGSRLAEFFCHDS